MENKTMFGIAIILIIASSLLLVFNFNKAIVASETTDNIIMNLSEVKVCCTYIDGQGKERSCIIQQRFDCSICSEKCTPVS